MNTRRLVTAITFLAIFAMAARISIDTDTWWHLRAGQWMIEHRSILLTDVFSYTRGGQPWQYPGWLVELPMYWIYQLLGPGGLNLWTAWMVTLAFVFVWFSMSGGVFLRAFTSILAAAVSGVYWAARPYLVTFVLAAVFLWVLEDFRWKRTSSSLGRLWLLPLLMVVWANSHGGFAVGFLLWGVYLAGELWSLARSLGRSEASRQRSLFLGLTGGLMVLAVCVNPSGPAMLLYPFKTVSIGALQDYIQEWQSPDFHSLSVQPFIWLLLLTLGALGISRRRLALTDFLLVSGFAYMGFLAGRNVALFALAAPPVLTRHAQAPVAVLERRLGLRLDAQRRAGRFQRALNMGILAVLSLAVILKASTVYPLQVNQEAYGKSLPVGAVAFIRQEMPPGRLFNSYNWGGYLLWALPEYPVFIDGRTDLYNDEIISQWMKVVRAEDGWQDVLDQWKVKLVLVEPGTPLVVRLQQNNWNLLYEDEKSVVYAR